MAKHTWLTAPTPAKAKRVLAAYLHVAARDGRAPATVFAGYWCERVAQDSGLTYNPGTLMANVYDRAAAAGHRYAGGKNFANYHKVWQDHAPLMLPLATARLAPLAGLAPDAPWYAVADALRDANLDALAGALVVLAAAVDGSGPAS